MYSYNRREIRGEKLLILMPLVYSGGFVFSEYLSGFGLAISFISILIFSYAFITIKNRTSKSISIKSAYILALYSLVSLIVTISLNYDGIRSIFLNPALILPYLSVLLSTKRYDFNMPKIIIKGIEISAILFIIFSFFNFKEFLGGYSGIEAIRKLHDESISFDYVSKYFAACIGLGLLFAQYLKPRTLIILLVAFAINLTMAIFLGRRNIIFTNCLYLLASCFLYAKYSNLPSFLKYFIFFIGISASIYGALNFTSFLQTSDNPLFKTLSDRLNVDSRGKVLDYYDKDMNSSPLNWIFGKGIESKYYCPGIEGTSYRRTVEAGWRQIIMKVGIIGFILYLLMLLPAVLSKKQNNLTRALGIYILIGIIELYPAGVPMFCLQYVLLWIAASICNDKKFATLSNHYIKSQLLPYK